MPMIRGCFCFSSLRTGSKASAYFTLASAVINIIIDIWLLESLFSLEKNLEDNEKWILLPPGILVLMFLELACNIGLLVVGMCLLIGINRKYSGESMVRTWKIGVTFFRLYEAALGIYILAWIGAYRVGDIVYMFPQSIWIAAYWILDTIIMVAAIICVSSYWDELMDGVYGKERRTKFFSMLSNIRSAASGRRPGTATPSQYSYYAMSRQTLTSLPSQPPLSQSSGHQGYPPHMYQHQQQPQYGGPPPQQQHYGGPPPQQYGGHPQQQHYGGQPQQQHYGGHQQYSGPPHGKF